MDPVVILERIVKENGSCSWSRPSICAHCPLGQMTREDSSTYQSCVEALHIDGLSKVEQDARYKQAAIDKLADLTIEMMIEADDGVKHE